MDQEHRYFLEDRPAADLPFRIRVEELRHEAAGDPQWRETAYLQFRCEEDRAKVEALYPAAVVARAEADEDDPEGSK